MANSIRPIWSHSWLFFFLIAKTTIRLSIPLVTHVYWWPPMAYYERLSLSLKSNIFRSDIVSKRFPLKHTTIVMRPNMALLRPPRSQTTMAYFDYYYDYYYDLWNALDRTVLKYLLLSTKVTADEKWPLIYFIKIITRLLASDERALERAKRSFCQTFR